MIKTKEDLRYYLSVDGAPDTRSKGRKVYDFFFRNADFYIRKYLKALRYFEYYLNNKNNSFFHTVFYHYYALKWRRIRHKTGMLLFPNTIGPGVKLYHTYGGNTGVVEGVKVGRNVIIRPGLILGYQGDAMRTSMDAPIVDDYVEFSWNVKVFGKIHIGRGALLNTGCVPMTNVPPYSIVAGNPAKVVGFTKTPDEVIEFEKTNYPPEQRYSREFLESNYKKYFVSRIGEIRKLLRISL